MKIHRTLLAAVVSVGLVAAPAVAVGPPEGKGKPSNPSAEHKPALPGPSGTAQAKRRAYGQSCADQSKVKVAGEKGTAFSRCVTALAKVSGEQSNPRKACATLSKKHVKSEKGSPFSRCVKAAAQLQEEVEPEPEPEPTPEPTVTPEV